MQQRLGAALGWLLGTLPSRAAHVTRCNLALVAPPLQLDAAAAMRGYGRGILDTLKIWGSEPAQLLTQIEVVEGEALLHAAIAHGKGVLIAAPHLGAFELLNLYLVAQGPLSILYKSPKQRWLEPFLSAQRARSGATPVAASASGVRTLLKALKRGEMVGILPDQQPKLGDGEFADFFGVPAFTMTLFCKLARSAGAQPLLAFAARTARGYRIHIQNADALIAAADLPVALRALNAGVEALVRQAPEQYQWSYKRFSMRPSQEAGFY